MGLTPTGLHAWMSIHVVLGAYPQWPPHLDATTSDGSGGALLNWFFNFAPELVLGEGEFGHTYKGCLKSGGQVS
ncbi:hypothetical protein MKW92_002390 [Papaver armeniacum]|nr:hypothetical protein MKW92_002390 [Papaver armeniacum]